MSQKEFEKIVSFLNEKNVKFELIEHESVFTSNQAAKVCGCALQQGIKAIVLKLCSAKFILACVSGDKKIDLKKLAVLTGEKKFSLLRRNKCLKQPAAKLEAFLQLEQFILLKLFLMKRFLKMKLLNSMPGFILKV